MKYTIMTYYKISKQKPKTKNHCWVETCLFLLKRFHLICYISLLESDNKVLFLKVIIDNFHKNLIPHISNHSTFILSLEVALRPVAWGCWTLCAPCSRAQTDMSHTSTPKKYMLCEKNNLRIRFTVISF